MALDIEELELQLQQTSSDTGDHDRFAHYVEKEQITEAVVNGWPVIALCGKIWVPSRDPSKYPICPECRDLMAELQLPVE